MNRRSRWILGVGMTILAGAAAFWALRPLIAGSRGNIHEALRVDLADFGQTQLLEFVGDLKLEGSTPAQRLELFTRIKARFDAMGLVEKLSMMLAMWDVYEKDPKGVVVENGRMLMQEYWTRETCQYMEASPEVRRKMLDERIDEGLIFENVQKVQEAARSLVGWRGTQPSEEEVRRIQIEIARTIVDSMQNRPPEERARATQYFLDMRARRQERGLRVLF